MEEQAVTNDPRIGAVVDFFDMHPINEQQIIEKLQRDGFDPNAVTEDILQNYDQDHYGGVEATDALAEIAGIDDRCQVLDVCCGLGGPARYLAHNYRCPVTGIDLAESRISGAKRLTAMTALDDRVKFETANALNMPFEDNTFDVLISQEAFCHIPDKDRLLSECLRVLTTGGRIAFTDILTTSKISKQTQARLQHEMAFQELGSAESYRTALQKMQCEVEVQDLSQQWRFILADRLAMYRGMKDQTVEHFGQAHFDKWDNAYSYFVGLYETGELGGARFLVRRNNNANPKY
jgi:sarcosine/dimethylglycine N-methyltransferase